MTNKHKAVDWRIDHSKISQKIIDKNNSGWQSGVSLWADSGNAALYDYSDGQLL